MLKEYTGSSKIVCNLILKPQCFRICNIIMIICFVYISPEGSTLYNNSDEKDGIKNLENYLYTVRTDYPDCSLLIAGDLNARCRDFLDFILDDSLNEIFGEVPYLGDSFELPKMTVLITYLANL